MATTVFDRLQEAIVQTLNIESWKVTASSKVEDFEADSLTLFEFKSHLEQEFSIDLPEEERHNIFTVGELEDYISSRINSQ